MAKLLKRRKQSPEAFAAKDAQQFIAAAVCLELCAGQESTQSTRDGQAEEQFRKQAKAFSYPQHILDLVPQLLLVAKVTENRLNKATANGLANSYGGTQIWAAYKAMKSMFTNTWNALYKTCVGPDGEPASGKDAKAVIVDFLDKLWVWTEGKRQDKMKKKRASKGTFTSLHVLC